VQATLETDAKYNYMMNEQRQNAHDKTFLPLAPYMPSDPLPPLINGHATTMFGAAPPISPRAPIILHPVEPPNKDTGAATPQGSDQPPTPAVPQAAPAPQSAPATPQGATTAPATP